jgi:hypothetical protein
MQNLVSVRYAPIGLFLLPRNFLGRTIVTCAYFQHIIYNKIILGFIDNILYRINTTKKAFSIYRP